MTVLGRRLRLLTAAAVLWAALGAQGAGAVVQPVYVGTIGGPGHAEIYPGGVDVDANGVLYAADTGNSRVVAYQPDGSVKWSRGTHTTKKGLGDFDNPRDVAYLNGNLYVADLGNKRVQVLDAASGTPILAWSVVLPSPIGLSAGVDGNGNPVILVAQDTKNQINEYTPDGVFIRSFGSSHGGSGDGDLSAPRDAATDSLGNVYVADYGNNRIAKFAPDGTWITSWGGSGGLNGRFRRPYGVVLDAQDRVYVADSTNHRLQIFDSNGTFLAKYGTAGTGPGEFSQLRRVAVQPAVANPDIYLADLWGFKVERVSQDGSFNFTYDQTFGGVPPPDGLFNEPSGLNVDANHIYVADAVNQRMQRYDTATGTWQLQWGERGWGGDLLGFNWPRDLTLNSVSNTIWVADTKNGRLVEFDPDGNATGRTFGSLGSQIGKFNRPYAIVSYGSSVIVADSANNRVQRWDMSTPTPTLVWNTVGPANPLAVAVDGATVLVTDTRNNQLLRLDAETGAQIGAPLGAGNLHSPEGVAVDADENIWVSDRAFNRLVEFAPDGTFLQAYGKVGSAHGQFNHPTHLAILGTRLYVCDVWNDRVEIYDLATPPTGISVGDASVVEGNIGKHAMNFTVSLSAPSAQTVTVKYATADGTATAGLDYLAKSGKLTFLPGQTTSTITIQVLGDVIPEDNETLFVNLSSPTNGVISDGQGVGTILDDDSLRTLSIGDATVTEPGSGTVAANFQVSLDQASGRTITVNYATADGSATSPIDYQATNGTLTFAPGETVKTVTVLVNADPTPDGTETFFVNLTSPTNATIGHSQGLGTIVDGS